MLKKVKELTVEELIDLGKADNVRNLRITIQDPNTENKHWDVIIGGTGYQKKLFLEDEVEVPDMKTKQVYKLSYVLIYMFHHQYGLVEFLDRNDNIIQVVGVDNLTNISTDFYSEMVEYKELLPTDNPYRKELVACIKFVDHTVEELRKMKK